MPGYCRGRNTGSAKAIVTAIRALLRFLRVSGRTSVSPATAPRSLCIPVLSSAPSHGRKPRSTLRNASACPVTPEPVNHVTSRSCQASPETAHHSRCPARVAADDLLRPGRTRRSPAPCGRPSAAASRCAPSAHRNPTSPGRDGVSPQVSHRRNGIPRHTAAHLLRWPCKPVTSIYADQAG